jgi:hypothetical protein
VHNFAKPFYQLSVATFCCMQQSHPCAGDSSKTETIGEGLCNKRMCLHAHTNPCTRKRPTKNRVIHQCSSVRESGSFLPWPGLLLRQCSRSHTCQCMRLHLPVCTQFSKKESVRHAKKFLFVTQIFGEIGLHHFNEDAIYHAIALNSSGSMDKPVSTTAWCAGLV